MPLTSDSHPPPMDRARYFVPDWPAIKKEPPATSSPVGEIANALMVLSDKPPKPESDQLVPSQRATPPTGAPPADLNVPPAIKSPFGMMVRARTAGELPGGPWESPAPS